MRTSLLPGLIGTLQTNLNRKESRIRIFELGRTFHHASAGYAQPTRLGGLAYGGAAPEQWGLPTRDVDFYDVKGDLETLIAPRRVTTETAEHPALHPGRSASVAIDGVTVGWLGELHPRLVRHFGLPKAPVVFEIAVDALATVPMPAGKPVSRLPIVRRDLGLVVDEAVPVQALLNALNDAKPSHVEAIRLFDVYRGVGLTEGKKSLAILVLMQDTSRTLTDADIAATEACLLAAAREKFGAALRQ
jgi:phenylalanyl-tRNA synthetase beta chain